MNYLVISIWMSTSKPGLDVWLDVGDFTLFRKWCQQPWFNTGLTGDEALVCLYPSLKQIK